MAVTCMLKGQGANDMKNVFDFSDKNSIADQAANWILRFEREGGLSAYEKDQLAAWLDQDSSHYEHFERLANVWSDANVLTELAVPIPQEVSFFDWLFNPAISTKLRLAAATMIMLFVVGVSAFIAMKQPIQSNGFVYTDVGDQKTINLADGSIIKLNTHSKARIEYSEDYRNIYLLRGEAHFIVAKNKRRPFRVYAGDGRIHAIGTAFSVYLKDGLVDITVSEGRVGIASIEEPRADIGSGKVNDKTIYKSINNKDLKPLAPPSTKALGTLQGGEAGIIVSQLDENENKTHTFDQLKEITELEVANRIAWTNGVLVFSGEPLNDVVKEISRYTKVSIEFAEPELEQIRIGGNFPVGETETMFSSLETSFGLQVTRLSSDRVLISSVKKY